jgi:uncharacterized membrane protein required for colicin V production
MILFFIVQGFRKGASGEVGCMLAWVFTGLTFYFGSSYIMEEILSFSFLRSNPDAAQFMSFIITLFVSIIIFFVLRKLLTDSISTTVPTPFNEILGTFFGVVKDSITIKLLQPVITKILHR